MSKKLIHLFRAFGKKKVACSECATTIITPTPLAMAKIIIPVHVVCPQVTWPNAILLQCLFPLNKILQTFILQYQCMKKKRNLPVRQNIIIAIT